MIPQSESPKALRLDLTTMQAQEVPQEQMPALKELARIYYAQQAAGIPQPDFKGADVAAAGIS